MNSTVGRSSDFFTKEYSRDTNMRGGNWGRMKVSMTPTIEFVIYNNTISFANHKLEKLIVTKVNGDEEEAYN